VVRGHPRAAFLAACVGAACFGAAAGAPHARAELTAPEALLKIEFIERFTRFVEWPAAAFERQELFILCIAGSGPVADSLYQVTGFGRFKDHPIAFRRVRPSDSLKSCHLLFVAADEASNVPAFVAATINHPILTIVDVPRSAERGALISFYREGERVLFEINLGTANKSGLKISSRLLKLARLFGAEKG
jgi:hypothetical protein